MLCGAARCSRGICFGSNSGCLEEPNNLRYEDSDVLFVCPPCHQDSDRRAKTYTPYYVRPMPSHIPTSFDF
jgi:hypothetical protein